MSNNSTSRHIVVAISGASGSIYAKQLLDILVTTKNKISVVMSEHAKEIWNSEIGSSPAEYDFPIYSVKDFSVPFASGSNACDSCVIVPCSMGMLGRIAQGSSEDLIARTADVCFKERKQLIVVPRETPYTRIQLENMLRIHDAGGIILPATPSFYSGAKNIAELVDTVVSRIVDHLGIEYTPMTKRWGTAREA